MKRPLIGITTATSKSETSGIVTLAAYERNVHAVERAGGLPVLVPCTLSEESLRALYERLDGILLPGGGDLLPEYWGESPHPKANGFDANRDRTEMILTRWAVADDLPIMGICRGHQVFNVALGGALIQDIDSQYENALKLKHDNFFPSERDLRTHNITVEPQSRLADLLGVLQISVNSLHHQAVRQAPQGVQVTALSPDGIIEATEIPDKRFALTVQWHPEDLQEGDDRMFNLFRAFVQAARGE